MKNAGPRNAGIFLCRHSPWSSLLGLLDDAKSLALLFVLCAACSACGRECHGEENEGAEDEDDDEYFSVRLSFESDGRYTAEYIDCFIYENAGLRRLLVHERLGPGSKEAVLDFPKCGNIIVAAVANCPFDIDRTAAGRFESLEKLRISSVSDSHICPVMSAVESADTGVREELTLKMELKVLWCRIIIDEISNSSGLRLERPELYLSLCNPEAEVFRTKGFRPTEQQEDTVKTALDTDLGYYDRYPMSELWCYPNDNEVELPGCERTLLNLEFRVRGSFPPGGDGQVEENGEHGTDGNGNGLTGVTEKDGTEIRTVTLSTPLPALERASCTRCRLTIDKDGRLNAKYY